MSTLWKNPRASRKWSSDGSAQGCSSMSIPGEGAGGADGNQLSMRKECRSASLIRLLNPISVIRVHSCRRFWLRAATSPSHLWLASSPLTRFNLVKSPKLSAPRTARPRAASDDAQTHRCKRAAPGRAGQMPAVPLPPLSAELASRPRRHRGSQPCRDPPRP